MSPAAATIRARIHESAVKRVTRTYAATIAEICVEALQNSRRGDAMGVRISVSHRLDGYGWYDGLDRVTGIAIQVAADGKWMPLGDWPMPDRTGPGAAPLPSRPAAIRIELAVRPTSGPASTLDLLRGWGEACGADASTVDGLVARMRRTAQ